MEVGVMRINVPDTYTEEQKISLRTQVEAFDDYIYRYASTVIGTTRRTAREIIKKYYVEGVGLFTGTIKMNKTALGKFKYTFILKSPAAEEVIYLFSEYSTAEGFQIDLDCIEDCIYTYPPEV